MAPEEEQGTPANPSDVKPTVYVVEDDVQVRAAVARMITEFGFSCSEFASAEEFLAAYPSDRDPAEAGPACLLLDVKLPRMDGLALQERLHERGIDLPTIFVTGYADVQLAVRALRRGAVDFVEKPFRAKELIASVREALANHAAELDRKAKLSRARQAFAGLTDRERQICRMASTGLANKAIAFELGVSPQAIDATRNRAFRKLGIENVAELVRLIVQIDA